MQDAIHVPAFQLVLGQVIAAPIVLSMQNRQGRAPGRRTAVFLARQMKTHTRWVLVASDSQAKIFEIRDGERPNLVQVLDHPGGRLMCREIDEDRPGRVFSPFGPRRHAMRRRIDPHDARTTVFARRVAAVIRRAKARNVFDDLVLIAKADFLGKLRGAIGAKGGRWIAGSLEKDITNRSDTFLKAYLSKMPRQA